ncbi:Hint domain-containing protein, partial [Labrys portucalensis]
MATYGPNNGGVVYNSTDYGPTLWPPSLGGTSLTISSPTGPDVTIGRISVLTTSGGNTALSGIPLFGALFPNNYAVPPGVSTTINFAVGALTTTNVYVAGNVTLGNGITLGTTTNIYVTGGNATMGGSVLAGGLNGVNVTLTDGGSFSNGGGLANLLSGTSVTFGHGGGTFTVNGGGAVIDLSSTSIHGFSQDNGLNHLQFNDMPAPAASYIVQTSGSSQNITVLDAGGNTIATATVDGDSLPTGTYKVGGPGPLTVDSNGGSMTVTDKAIVCFLAGTMIRTASGEVAIEKIQVGDEVFVSMDG